MNTSPNGIAVMHYFEAVKLIAYPDPASPLFSALNRAGIDPYNLPDGVPQGFENISGKPWAVGYGDTGPDVVPGLVITEDEADARFAARLASEFEPGVYVALNHEPSQAQFDGLVCLAYNIGLGNFRSSTLLKKFNAFDDFAAADQFLVWNRAGGKVLLGLRRRRAAERALFMGSTGAEAIAIGAAVK